MIKIFNLNLISILDFGFLLKAPDIVMAYYRQANITTMKFLLV